MKNWFNEFNCDRSSLKDEFRKGLSKTVVVPKNINAVRELIMPDRHVSYRKIKASIHPILREQLAVKKICALWIPLEKKYIYIKCEYFRALRFYNEIFYLVIPD